MQIHSRHDCIGKAYLVRLSNGSKGIYLMAFGGYDDEGDTTVHLVNIKTGRQLRDPVYVPDPYSLSDSDMVEIIDPELRGVEFVNLGSIKSITGYLEGPAVVQRTI